MNIYWPKAKLQTILAEAEASGSTRVWFETKSDAERFRYAVYGLAKRKKFVGKYTISLDMRTPAPLELPTAFCSIVVQLAVEPTILLEPAAQ